MVVMKVDLGNNEDNGNVGNNDDNGMSKQILLINAHLITNYILPY